MSFKGTETDLSGQIPPGRARALQPTPKEAWGNPPRGGAGPSAEVGGGEEAAVVKGAGMKGPEAFAEVFNF